MSRGLLDPRRRQAAPAPGGSPRRRSSRCPWPGCPKRAGIGWSVNQYGFEDAFVLAVLSRELESVDRKKLLATHKRIKGKARYKKILDRLELVYE